MADFLLEIGTEEIPARMIDSARDELSRRTADLLTRERLAVNPTIQSFSTPRRIAVLARNVASRQPDIQEQLTGPSLKIAFKDGAPTPAAEAFAKKAGVPVNSLEKISNAKGEYLAATVQKKGRAASEILAESLPKEIAGIYWAKSMYWRGKSAERFVRPVRWMVALLGDQVVPLEFGGVTAGHTSEGHRILASGAVNIAKPADYAAKLADAKVTATSAEREHTHPQGPRRRHAHRSWRSLARRQVAARHRREPHRMPQRHPRQLRSRVSNAARGSPRHGHARPPEVLRARRRRRQALAAFPRRPEY